MLGEGGRGTNACHGGKFGSGSVWLACELRFATFRGWSAGETVQQRVEDTSMLQDTLSYQASGSYYC
jgi:hypothetical protein